MFCDFGPEFTVFDVDREDPHSGIIACISNDSTTLVALSKMRGSSSRMEIWLYFLKCEG